MTRLALVSTLLGAFIVVSRLPGLIYPAKFREHMLKFPRSVIWGRVLMGIAAAIAWVVMYQAAEPTAREEMLVPMPANLLSALIHIVLVNGPILVLIGFPIAYWVVIQYANTFLAMRAAAALMLLAAKQMVEAADLSDLPSRLVVTVFAYLWVVAAIWMTIAPHHFRDLLELGMADDKRCRAICGVGVGVGMLFLALGLFVYTS